MEYNRLYPTFTTFVWICPWVEINGTTVDLNLSERPVFIELGRFFEVQPRSAVAPEPLVVSTRWNQLR